MTKPTAALLCLGFAAVASADTLATLEGTVNGELKLFEQVLFITPRGERLLRDLPRGPITDTLVLEVSDAIEESYSFQGTDELLEEGGRLINSEVAANITFDGVIDGPDGTASGMLRLDADSRTTQRAPFEESTRATGSAEFTLTVFEAATFSSTYINDTSQGGFSNGGFGTTFLLSGNDIGEIELSGGSSRNPQPFDVELDLQPGRYTITADASSFGFDDGPFDQRGVINFTLDPLTDPAPEPATPIPTPATAVAGLFGLTLLAARRRRDA